MEFSYLNKFVFGFLHTIILLIGIFQFGFVKWFLTILETENTTQVLNQK